MKLSALITLLLPAAGAFTLPTQHHQTLTTTTTTLSMTTSDRRAFVKSVGTIAATVPFLVSAAPPAFAEYVPKLDDMKQIAGFGISLDSLATKVADPNQFESALEGIRVFNRDKNFYSGYARNFISKSVKKNAEADPRVGYVKQACNSISSLQELLEGRQGLEGKAAADEAVKRVRRAQELLALFIKESGVEDERLAAFVAAH